MGNQDDTSPVLDNGNYASILPGDPAQVGPGKVSLADEVLGAIREISMRQWAWLASGFVIAIGLIVVRDKFVTEAEQRLTWEHADLYSQAFGQAAAGLIVLLLITALGLSHEAGITSDWQRRKMTGSWVLIVGCLLPVLAVRGSSWNSIGRLGAAAAEFASTAFLEAVGFLGLIFVFLARRLANHDHGVFISAVATAIIYAATQGSASMLIMAPFFVLAFIWLLFEVRSIWPVVVLFTLFQWLAGLPFDTDGAGEGSGLATVAKLVVVVAAGLAVRRLVTTTDPWQAVMSENVAPVVIRR